MKSCKIYFPTGLLLTCFLFLNLTGSAQSVSKITAGGFHNLFLKSDGSLWGMGYNAWGQLGDGGISSQNSPEQVLASNVTTIAGGGFHSLFLKSDNSLWAMGLNNCGQLGDNAIIDTTIWPEQAMIWLEQIVIWPEQIVTNSVVAIAGGEYHSLFLKSDGSLWAMGKNTHGQLGDGTWTNVSIPEQVASNVTAFATGMEHSLFIKSDGSL